MLTRIFIQNFALIDALEINLQEGLQVITGETGAGKSIILGALRLILGERADTKSIANSEQKSIVEAEFSLNDNFISIFERYDADFESHTIIRREILPNGKSRAFINDVPVTLDILKNLASYLIDIHSQFETSNLFSEEYQFKIIDGLGNHHELLKKYQTAFAAYQSLLKNVKDLKERLSQNSKDADYQHFLLSELNDAQLDEVNFEELQIQLSTQENVGAISENIAIILSRFDAEEIGILDALNDVRNKLSKTADLSHQFTEINQRFEENFVEFKDILFELQNKSEEIETNPMLLEELHAKINRINSLFLKHKVNSTEELIEIRHRIAEENQSFATLEEDIVKAEEQVADYTILLEDFSENLAVLRSKAADDFSEKMESLLMQLGLENAKIEVQFTEDQNFNIFGKQRIAILFQANSGFPMKPIQNAISGGERSRVMLAVKKIMAENADLPTLILDEIDTGVSGKIADEMGKVMKAMSKDMQLIVITHLAQVAAKGDNNYQVRKTDVSGKTQTQIIPLNKEEKLKEIAQLLSGSKITDAALQQAEELINS